MKKLKAFFMKIKKYVFEDFIVTFITVLISVLIELVKQIVISANSVGSINCEVINATLQEFVTWRPIINAALITVIVWFVIGISKLLNRDNRGKRALLFTMILFIVAILTIIWYINEGLFPPNAFTTVVGLLLFVCLFFVLVLFLAERNTNKKNKVDTNNIIAGEPTENK